MYSLTFGLIFVFWTELWIHIIDTLMNQLKTECKKFILSQFWVGNLWDDRCSPWCCFWRECGFEGKLCVERRRYIDSRFIKNQVILLACFGSRNMQFCNAACMLLKIMIKEVWHYRPLIGYGRFIMVWPLGGLRSPINGSWARAWIRNGLGIQFGLVWIYVNELNKYQNKSESNSLPWLLRETCLLQYPKT